MASHSSRESLRLTLREQNDCCYALHKLTTSSSSRHFKMTSWYLFGGNNVLAPQVIKTLDVRCTINARQKLTCYCWFVCNLYYGISAFTVKEWSYRKRQFWIIRYKIDRLFEVSSANSWRHTSEGNTPTTMALKTCAVHFLRNIARRSKFTSLRVLYLYICNAILGLNNVLPKLVNGILFVISRWVQQMWRPTLGLGINPCSLVLVPSGQKT